MGEIRPFGLSPTPLRIGRPDVEPETIRFRGYRREGAEEHPAFLFEVDGVRVEQRLRSTGPLQFFLQLDFPDSAANTVDAERFYLIDPEAYESVSLSPGLSWTRPGLVSIPAGTQRATLQLKFRDTGNAFVYKKEEMSGRQLYSLYCAACHSLDGSKIIGPSFQGILGRASQVNRAGKLEEITIDRAYLEKSIRKPQESILTGFETTPMPDFSPLLTDDDIERLVDFMIRPE